MEGIKQFFQIRLFGVCSRIGDYLGIASKHIRLFFIYATFITLGSPIFIYLSLAFIKELRHYIRTAGRKIWDL